MQIAQNTFFVLFNFSKYTCFKEEFIQLSKTEGIILWARVIRNITKTKSILVKLGHRVSLMITIKNRVFIRRIEWLKTRQLTHLTQSSLEFHYKRVLLLTSIIWAKFSGCGMWWGGLFDYSVKQELDKNLIVSHLSVRCCWSCWGRKFLVVELLSWQLKKVPDK